MAEEHHKQYEGSESRDVEVQDRGVLDFLGKKKEGENKPQEEVIATEFDDKVKVSDEADHEKKPSLLEKLHRSDSSSSSSSEEEVEEGGKKIRKKKEKKGLKEKVEEKIGHKKEEEHHEESGAVPVEKVEVHHTEEKKGFLDKIKEKLPGGANKKAEEHTATTTPPPPPPPPAECVETAHQHHEHEAQGEAKEKKGILEKIKEKLPGYHPKSEDDKEKEKQSASH
ncbi:hypothetical protein HN51_025897 [Arachis hypogaea]|uniref:Dehydrin n=1 Tax=Arachis hypogaea TaxID=3818 RepID=A0A445CFL9_ARAHY|nr:phosphoprotein ECPP44 [Arachis hypogaea]QHO28405.1 Dehydrin [Arachis hypogaea]RYR49713.1 hypothetical protein Ahy_A07g036249 isoform A [Arachis hypogaea]RYR49714.1 hypothetical protein Ahy_A07g036249 isoform B [Arachis hypogaea]RYR49715.1 hypothetical protein Ahy_A07g036249 isoform C [Arachis hypogaea]RYR49716.1 hypothetical protein Ahy_A07g036249 isoform D [Arachis hypogaea]